MDYLIVFEKKSEKRVQLITAYPIFFVSAKKDYEKDYQNYIKEDRKRDKIKKTGNRNAKTGFSF